MKPVIPTARRAPGRMAFTAVACLGLACLLAGCAQRRVTAPIHAVTFPSAHDESDQLRPDQWTKAMNARFGRRASLPAGAGQVAALR